MSKSGHLAIEVIARLLGALLLVYGTYNPEGISYYHWALSTIDPTQFSFSELPPFNPLKVFTGVVLITGWIIFITAARKSLGVIGIALSLALLGSLVWVLIDYGVLPVQSGKMIQHIVLIVMALVLTIGLSWSHISRKMTGQIDTDTLDE
ncbi:MAG: hypothetical protein B6244_05385 [Candidatus Cloacimonetes bacterium 4572_55]|nr:MAG: hypothetical protein B6244_05385 [Candidatus Cloacimonetes bacterium 4572_55]